MSSVASTVGRVGAGVFTLGASEGLRALTKNALKTPTPPEGQPPATTSDPAVQAAAAQGATRRSRARGYRSTILSQQFMQPVQPAGDLKTTIGA
jgi:hypothetical protein